MVSFRVPTHTWYGSQVAPSDLLFANYLQHFWSPASHLLGICYLWDDLQSTHTLSKYHIYNYIYIYIYFTHASHIYNYIYISHIYIYINVSKHKCKQIGWHVCFLSSYPSVWNKVSFDSLSIQNKISCDYLSVRNHISFNCTCQFKTRFPVTTYHFENDRIMMHPDPSHHIIMTTGQYTKSKTQGRRVKVGAALVSAGFRFKHVKPEKAKQYIMESILQSDKKSSHTAS